MTVVPTLFGRSDAPTTATDAGRKKNSRFRMLKVVKMLLRIRRRHGRLTMRVRS